MNREHTKFPVYMSARVKNSSDIETVLYDSLKKLQISIIVNYNCSF